MSYHYMVKGLEISPTGVPIFPGAHHVSPQVPGYFVAYKKVGRSFIAMAVIYRDFISTQCLVGAEQEVLDTIPGGETLNQIVNVNPADWGCWSCDTIGVDLGEGPQLLSDVLTFTGEIISTISQLQAVVLSPTLVTIGGRPTAPFSLGSFLVEEIEAETVWIGDHHAV